MTAISPSEVIYYLSNPNAGTGYSGTGTPGNSLGKWMSTTQVSSNTLDDLFLDISGASNASEVITYQCLFVMNNTVTGNSMKTPWFWMPASLYTPGGATVTIAPDPTGVTPYQSASQQALSINSPNSAPAGISTWYGPTSGYGTGTGGFQIADIPPQYCAAIWVQQAATASPAIVPQSFSLQVTFVSAAT